MLNKLKGKKLLITGGCRLSEDIVKTAKEAGIYTIVADWHDTHTSPAKLMADEYWQESIQDYDRLIELMKEKGVDGVTTGFTDSYLVPYAILCEKAGLPSYATPELFARTLDKSIFKQMCKDNGVPTVPEYDPDTFDPSIISSSNKVIIKPVDNSGSRGIVVCDNPEKFEGCMKYALDYSAKKKVVIEKYIEMDSLSISYTLQNGTVSLTTINDSFIHKAPNVGGTACGSIYPSKYTDAYIKIIDSTVKKMLKNEGFKNGVLFIQAFSNGTEFYLFEMGYRLSGGRHYVWTDYENKTNAVEQLINFALTGQMADYVIAERDNANFPELCCRVYILGYEGLISKIEGLEKLEALPGLVDLFVLKKEGEVIGKDGTTAQQIAVVNFTSKNMLEFEEKIQYIKENYKVFDKEGNNLVRELLK